MSRDPLSEPPVELPHGIVTFLLTDIEASRQLWELHAAAMGAALVRHEALIEATVTAHRGRLIKSQGEGDSTPSVFPRATDAVHAALGLQQAFSTSIPIGSLGERATSPKRPITSARQGVTWLRPGSTPGDRSCQGRRLWPAPARISEAH